MSQITTAKIVSLANQENSLSVEDLIAKLSRQLPPSSVAPTVRAVGKALVEGDSYFNTTDKNQYVWKGSNGWVKDAAGGANSDITSLSGLTTPLSLLQGGTGANSQVGARTALGLKSASLADILGTVSQVGGIPTGSVVEKGSNLSGEYVRLADGTQICWFSGVGTTVSTTALGNLFSSAANTWTYPMSFAANSEPTFLAMCNSGGSWIVVSGAPTNTVASWQRLTSYSDSVGRASRFFAIGRWY